MSLDRHAGFDSPFKIDLDSGFRGNDYLTGFSSNQKRTY